MHFLALLNKQSGGVPSNTYTQTTSCNGNPLYIFFAILIIVIFSLIGFFAYSVIKDTSSITTQKQQSITKNPAINKDQETQILYKKICKLDSTDLSKADGFVEALLSADKYSNSAKENSQESD